MDFGSFCAPLELKRPSGHLSVLVPLALRPIVSLVSII